jgi:hypothetical protein
VQLALKFRNMLPNIVREELDSLVAIISAFWSKEHNPDGTHGAIHADSITIGGVPVGSGGGGLPLTTKGDLVAHDGTTNVRVPVGAIGRVLTADPSAAPGVSWQIPATVPAIYRTITFGIDGRGSPITAGIQADVSVPYAGTITGWTLLADQVGSCVIDILKDAYANYPPVAPTDSIVGATPPTLSSAAKASVGAVSGWTPTVNVGDTLRFSVTSSSTITRLSLVLAVAS